MGEGQGREEIAVCVNPARTSGFASTRARGLFEPRPQFSLCAVSCAPIYKEMRLVCGFAESCERSVC